MLNQYTYDATAFGIASFLVEKSIRIKIRIPRRETSEHLRGIDALNFMTAPF